MSGLKLIPEVITDMLLKSVPETTGFQWEAKGQDGGKEASQLSPFLWC